MNILESARLFDEQLFLAINGSFATPLLDALFTLITVAGDAIVWLAFGTIFIVFYGGKESRKRLIIFLLTMAVGGLCLNLTKEYFDRDRPSIRFAHEVDSGKIVVHTPYKRHGYRSFPSGHSQAAFTAAGFFIFFYRKKTILLLTAATLTAFSRVYLGVHFPADIIAGSIMGILISYLSYRLYISSRPASR